MLTRIVLKKEEDFGKVQEIIVKTANGMIGYDQKKLKAHVEGVSK